MAKNIDKAQSPLFIVSPPPYLRSGLTIGGIMNTVSLALLPAAGLGVYLFGFKALLTLLTAILSSLLFEYLYNRLAGEESTIHDGSASLTGLLLGMNLPPYFPWWGTVSGSFFAVIIVKNFFGGLGYNIFNPALAGRVFLLLSWPAFMSSFPFPERVLHEVDAVTEATPLTAIKTLHFAHDPVATILSLPQQDFIGLFLGSRGGSIGEVSILALLLGGLFLLYRGTITWHIPLSMIASSMLTGLLFNIIDPSMAPGPIFHLLTGGLVLGAFFMATDYVSSPTSFKGMIIFGAGCGFLTILIRQYGGYPEGVSFAVLIMNMFVPFIDKYTKPVKFGLGKNR